MQDVDNYRRRNIDRVEYWPLMTGEFGDSAGHLEISAPYDGRLLAKVETADSQQVQRSLAIAYSLFKDRTAWLPLAERIGILERCARILYRDQDVLAMTMAREGGKPLLDCRAEIQRAIDGVGMCVEHIRTDAGSVVPLDSIRSTAIRLAVTQYEPVGVVVAVSAFNQPFDLIVHQAAAAVAAGCPVIWQLPVETPLSCLQFAAILARAGLPAAWCQAIVADSRSTTESLVVDSRVGFFSFTGISENGWKLAAKLAPGTPCMLNHGAAATVFLLPDADRGLAAEYTAKGAFYHAGQACMSVQRVFVPATLAYNFAGLLAQRAAKLKLGDPANAGTEIGPLIHTHEVTRLRASIDAAVTAGAELLTGGSAIGASLFRPTVLFNPPPDAAVSRLEVIGPVVCVYPYDSLDDAVDVVNELPFVRHAAVFTSMIDSALHVFKRVEASVIVVNDHTAFRSDEPPFAGLHESGLGAGGSPFSINEMRIGKMLVLNSQEL